MEDVFKFDSELAKDEMDEEDDKGDNNDEEEANKKMSVSLEDLKDALNDDVATTTDNDSESDFKECSSGAYGDELRCGGDSQTARKSQFLTSTYYYLTLFHTQTVFMQLFCHLKSVYLTYRVFHLLSDP